MARTVFIPSRVYQPGIISRTVDTFPVDVERIVARFTRETWPGLSTDTVAKVKIMWDDNSALEWDFPGGVLIHPRTGLPVLETVVSINVPAVGDPAFNFQRWKKINVVGGTITFEVFQALRTAIQIEAM